MKITNRIGFIDFLKFIGLSLVIFAHIEGPSFLNEIRTFDVPLLVFISSYLGRIKTDNIQSNDELLFYISSRIKRIVFPTWFFLIVYFLIRAICGKFYSPSYYLFTFLLTKKVLDMCG